MFDTKILLSPKIMRDVVPSYDTNINHWRQLADDDENMAAVLPGKPSSTGLARLFSPIQAALVAIMADFIRVDVKAPLAAKIARRVMEAHLAQPSVGQWAVVVTANGNVSTLAYDETGLRAGFVSGSRLAFALVLDLRNYAERVDAAIADAPNVIGGQDGE